MGSRRALDAVNFVLADVKDGLGPFLAIFLMTGQHWDATRIGLVMAISGIATYSNISSLGSVAGLDPAIHLF